jgi:hypothetical protein
MDRYTVTRKRMGSLKSISNGRKRVRLMIPQIDQSCFSCSAYKSLFLTGSCLRNRLAFLRRITGAYVSGRVGIMMAVQTPANIIMTQKTHRHVA